MAFLSGWAVLLHLQILPDLAHCRIDRSSHGGPLYIPVPPQSENSHENRNTSQDDSNCSQCDAKGSQQDI